MAQRNAKKFGLLALILCQASVTPSVSGSEANLYDALVQQMTNVPIKRGHGLLPDVSGQVCPMVTSQKLERLSNIRPDDVKPNIGLSERSTGFPPGTSHWLVRGEWLDVWERMSFAINLNDAGFCQAFAGPLTVEEPNFNFDRDGT